MQSASITGGGMAVSGGLIAESHEYELKQTRGVWLDIP